MIHAIAWMVLGVIAWKLVTRPKRDPMRGRIVSNGPTAFIAINTAAWREALQREREARDVYESAQYRRDCANRRARFERDLI